MVAIADGYQLTTEKDKVLILERDIAVIRMICRVLERDYHIFHAYDCIEANGILERENIGIVICDYGLNGSEGLEFLKRVQSVYPKILRVLLTGTGDNNKTIKHSNKDVAHIFLGKLTAANANVFGLAKSSNVSGVLGRREILPLSYVSPYRAFLVSIIVGSLVYLIYLLKNLGA